MVPSGRNLAGIVWAVAAAFLIIHFLDSMWSTSADMSAHVLMARQMMDHWDMSAAAALLADTTIYPRLSLLVAAVLGAPLDSAVAGVQLTGLLSVAAAWTAIAALVLTLPRGMREASVAVLIVLLVANRALGGLELFGNEIVHNFFVPQIFGQAAGLGVLWIAVRMEQLGRDARLRYLLLAIAAPTLAWAHIVPTLEVLGVLALVVAGEAVLYPKEWRTAAVGGLLVLASAVAVALHPVFRYMLRIAVQNGGLPLRWTEAPWQMAALAGIVALASAGLLTRWVGQFAADRRETVAVKYLGLLGIATAGLTLVQLVMLALGWGASYACRKYAFTLNTLLLLDVAVAFGFAARRVVQRRDTVAGFLFDGTAPAALLLVAMLTVLPADKIIDVPGFVEAERFARDFVRRSPPNPPGTYDFAVAVADGQNWTLSLAALGTPWSEDLFHSGGGLPFVHPERVAHVLTAIGSRWDIASCRTGFASRRLVVVDGPCAVAVMARRS